MSKITYVDKVTSNPQPAIPEANKVTGSNMTEIKDVVNANDTSTVSHIGNTLNPHSVTKAQVGLTSVDDTSDLAKPISTATQTALDGKIESLTGVGVDNLDPLNPVMATNAGDIGLGNANDTSDADKPVSTATQTALDLKVSNTLVGEPTGADAVVNMISLTQAEYDAGTPVATTFYIITDA